MEFKLDDLKCNFCEQEFESSPRVLPCGWTVCSKHIDKRLNTIDCFICKNHEIDCESNFPVNRMVELKLFFKKLAREKENVENKFDEFKQAKEMQDEAYLAELKKQIGNQKSDISNVTELYTGELYKQVVDKEQIHDRELSTFIERINLKALDKVFKKLETDLTNGRNIVRLRGIMENMKHKIEDIKAEMTNNFPKLLVYPRLKFNGNDFDFQQFRSMLGKLELQHSSQTTPSASSPKSQNSFSDKSNTSSGNPLNPDNLATNPSKTFGKTKPTPINNTFSNARSRETSPIKNPLSTSMVQIDDQDINQSKNQTPSTNADSKQGRSFSTLNSFQQKPVPQSTVNASKPPKPVTPATKPQRSVINSVNQFNFPTQSDISTSDQVIPEHSSSNATATTPDNTLDTRQGSPAQNLNRPLRNRSPSPYTLNYLRAAEGQEGNNQPFNPRPIGSSTPFGNSSFLQAIKLEAALNASMNASSSRQNPANVSNTSTSEKNTVEEEKNNSKNCRYKVYTGSSDRKIKILELDQGFNYNSETIKILKGHTGAITSLEILGDNKLISSSNDARLKVWDTDKLKNIKTLGSHAFSVKKTALLSPVKLISSSSDSNLKIWNFDEENYTVKHSFGTSSLVSCIERLSDRVYVTGLKDGSIRMWDGSDCINEFKKVHKGLITSIKKLDDDTLATSSIDNTIKIIRISNGSVLRTLEGHLDEINCIEVLSNDMLVSGSSDCTIKVWRISDGECLKTIENISRKINCIQVLNADIILCATDNGFLRVIDLKEKKCLKILKLHEDSIDCLKVERIF